MRKFLMMLAAGALVATPAMAAGDQKSTPSKAERDAAEDREDTRKCPQKRQSSKDKCKAAVPVRGETPSAGPIDRAYNAPFF